jgi:enolase
MKRIAPVLLGCDALGQAKLDAKVSEFDGTPNKRKLGVNALLGVSLASAHVDLAVFCFVQHRANSGERLLKIFANVVA